jgi:2-iminoacetate synthase ThiH
VSRIYLDNFDHLTAYWVSLGLPLASLALNYGVDDLHGTIMEEKIFHMAGAKTPTYQTMRSLEKAIREAGREPMQRDTLSMPPHPFDLARAAGTWSGTGLRVIRWPALSKLRIGCVQYLNARR